MLEFIVIYLLLGFIYAAGMGLITLSYLKKILDNKLPPYKMQWGKFCLQILLWPVLVIVMVLAVSNLLNGTPQK